MITYHSGDIFASEATALVNPVNCEGVQGKGLAKTFRERFPDNAKSYQERCKTGLLIPGGIFISGTPNNRHIVYLATKDKWSDPSKLLWVCCGLNELRKYILSYKIPSIAIPALGCGCGGLSWEEVKPEIALYMNFLPNTKVMVFEPQK